MLTRYLGMTASMAESKMIMRQNGLFVYWDVELLDSSEMEALASPAYVRAMANRESRLNNQHEL